MSSQHYDIDTIELIRRLRDGDTQAERALFERHAEDLLSRARRDPRATGLRPASGPEDVVQKVFVRALTSGLFSRFRDPQSGALLRILHTILDRVVVDEYRYQNAERRGGGHSGSGSSVADPDRSWILGLHSRETTPTSQARFAELLELCGSQLAPDELQIWRLSAMAGLDSPEIAEIVGGTGSAVRGKLLRAKKKLLRAMVAWDRRNRESRRTPKYER